MKKQKQMIIGLVILVLIVVLAIILIATGGSGAAQEEAAQVQTGVQYLQQLEAQSTEAVEAELKEIRRQERMEALENGEIDVWQQLEDAVILGDSRAVGFYYFGYMPQTRVLAEAGDTILKVEEHLGELQSLNPSQVFLCYGINDVGIGIWPTAEEYAVAMQETIESIYAVLPDTVVYVNGILVARDPAFSRNSAWYDIPEYNDALAAMCEENGYKFIDNTALCDTYADMWETDGIHVRTTFYPYWAANLVEATYEDE